MKAKINTQIHTPAGPHHAQAANRKGYEYPA